jgi:hypothetical protein
MAGEIEPPAHESNSTTNPAEMAVQEKNVKIVKRVS